MRYSMKCHLLIGEFVLLSLVSLSESATQLHASLFVNSTREFVTSLRDSISAFSDRHLHLQFTFKHNALSGSESRARFEQESQNTCKVDQVLSCDEYVFEQASFRDKYYVEAINSLFQGHLDYLSETTVHSFLPVMHEIHRLRLSNQHGDESESRIEAGGGAGFGFQLYCDDRMVLTAGGGGGGGIEGHFSAESSTVLSLDDRHNSSFFSSDSDRDRDSYSGSNRYSYGAGAGLGLQFDLAFACSVDGDEFPDDCARQLMTNPSAGDQSLAVTSGSFMSLGGGGGCGIGTSFSSQENKTLAWLQCGLQKDVGVMSQVENNGSSILSKFWQRINTCGSIRAEGGGGGGGGTAKCCASSSIGFGFNFSFSNVQSDQSNESANDIYNILISNTSEVAQNTSDPDFTSITPSVNGFDSYRENYDAVGVIVHQVSVACGGFSSWSCICAGTKRTVKSCADETTNTASLDNISYTLFNCSYIRQHLPQLQFIMRDDWCDSSDSYSMGTNSSENKNSSQNKNYEQDRRYQVQFEDIAQWNLSQWDPFALQLQSELSNSASTGGSNIITNDEVSYSIDDPRFVENESTNVSRHTDEKSSILTSSYSSPMRSYFVIPSLFYIIICTFIVILILQVNVVNLSDKI